MGDFLKILNRVSRQLINVNEEIEIYQIMNDGMKDVFPDVYFLITKLQPDKLNFRITHSFGFEKFTNIIQTLLGRNIFEMDFAYSDLNEGKQKAFENCQLYHFEGGIYDLANGKINETICKTIERILGISQIYSISFSVEKHHFGAALFFIPKATFISDETKLVLETIAFQASNAINKLRHIQAVKKASKDLVLTQSRFNQLVNLMNDIVWKANGDGTEIIDLSDSFEKYYGYKAKDFNENPNLWFKIIHPEDKAIVEVANKVLLNIGRADCEYRIIKPDGSINWLQDRKSIIFDDFGNAIQMGGITIDITEKKLIEEQLILKNYALDNSPSAIGLADISGKITYVNKKYVELFGYNDKSEIIGVSISEFATSNNKPNEVLNNLKEGKQYFGEIVPKRKDGSFFHSLISASPIIHNNKLLCVMAVFVDITNLKELESNLKQNELRLSILNKEKDTFFSIIAHDLKSPFNGILGLLDILLNNYENYSDTERLKIIQSSFNSSQKAYNLLTDLLQWAQLQNHHFVIKNELLNLNDIINENIELYSKRAAEKEIVLENNVNSNINVIIDRNSINSIIRNILNNAIKFTNAGGKVELNVIRGNEYIELSIKDNGVGMSHEKVDKLFRIDENLSTTGTRNESGTGLGLFICNDLVIKNNWKMEIESQLKQGTTVKIFIPN